MSRAVSLRVIVMAGLAALSLAGCGKGKPPGSLVEGASAASPAGRSARKAGGDAFLTKEEVSAIIGEPVTAMEPSGRNSMTYKTAVMGLQAHIEVEQRRSVADAVQAMQGARTATGFLGGAPEPVPGLGDEALFGAMNTLYLRKGDSFILVQPPNLQQVAGFKAYNKMADAKTRDETAKAIEELKETQKNDPAAAGLSAGDATQGALAVVKASAQKTGTPYETDARAMARALAAKVLEKL